MKAGRRSQLLIARGKRLIFGVGIALGLASGCGHADDPPPVEPPLGHAGRIDNPEHPDAETSAGAAGAAGAAVEPEPDAGSDVPVRLGIIPSTGIADPTTSDAALAELSVLAAGSRARSFVLRLDELLDASGTPIESVLAGLSEQASLQRAHGSALLLSIALVDRTEDARPASLRGSWNTPALEQALQALINRAFGMFGDDLAYLSFGTDVDRYLSLAAKSERSDLTAFIKRALDYARAQRSSRSSTRLGVTFSLPGVLSAELPETKELLAKSDALIITDYPFDASFRAQPAGSAVADLARLADAQAALPIVVQELGYPSAALAQSSAEQQQSFYDQLFELLGEERDRFPFLDLYALSDDDQAVCVRRAATFGAPGAARLVSALCSLGFRSSTSDADGSGGAGGAGGAGSSDVGTVTASDKPAWASALRALSAFARP